MKKKKRVITGIIIVGAVLSFILITSNHLIYARYITQKKKNQLISALNNRDFDSVRTLFSTRALNEAEDFEQGLSYLREICVGECIVYGDGGGGNGIILEMGTTYYEYDKIYWVKMNSEDYLLYFLYKTGPAKEDKGLYSLSFLRDEESEGSNYSSGRAGIYHPGWD